MTPPGSLTADTRIGGTGAGTGGAPDEEVTMTEVPGTDRDEAREKVLQETPLVPEDVEDATDDPRSTDHPTPGGDEGQTGDDVKPPTGSTGLDT